MRRYVIPLIALPLLAAGDVVVTPGKWTSTVTVTDVKMAGGPPGMAAMIKGKPTTVSYCITPAQAKQGARAALRADAGCRYTKFDAAAGRIATTMVCTRPGGGMTVQSTGSFTPTSFDITGHAVMTGDMPMTMTSRSVGRRTGNC